MPVGGKPANWALDSGRRASVPPTSLPSRQWPGLFVLIYAPPLS